MSVTGAQGPARSVTISTPGPPAYFFIHGICSTGAMWSASGMPGRPLYDSVVASDPHAARWTGSYGPDAEFGGYDTPQKMRDHLSQRLIAFSDLHPGSRVTVVGHSLGGLLAQYLLSSPAGSRISHIVTLDSPDIGVSWTKAQLNDWFNGGCSEAWASFVSDYLVRTSPKAGWLTETRELRATYETTRPIDRLLYGKCEPNLGGWSDCRDGNLVVDAKFADWGGAILLSYRIPWVTEDWFKHAQVAGCRHGPSRVVLPVGVADRGDWPWNVYHSWGTDAHNGVIAPTVASGSAGLDTTKGVHRCSSNEIFLSAIPGSARNVPFKPGGTNKEPFAARCTSVTTTAHVGAVWRHTDPLGRTAGYNEIIEAPHATWRRSFSLQDIPGTHTISLLCTDGGASMTISWTVMVLAPPGSDFDADGLDDSEEQKRYGTSPAQPDLFLEIDWIAGHKPTQETLDLVSAAFADGGIVVHFILDDEISPDAHVGGRTGSDTVEALDYPIEMEDLPEATHDDGGEGEQDLRHAVHVVFAGRTGIDRTNFAGEKFEAFGVLIAGDDRLARSGVYVFDGELQDAMLSPGWRPTLSEGRAKILTHELGHALGASHEHGGPGTPCGDPGSSDTRVDGPGGEDRFNEYNVMAWGGWTTTGGCVAQGGTWVWMAAYDTLFRGVGNVNQLAGATPDRPGPRFSVESFDQMRLNDKVGVERRDARDLTAFV